MECGTAVGGGRFGGGGGLCMAAGPPVPIMTCGLK